MAPKSLSRRPSEEKAVNKEPSSSSEEEESEDEGSESPSSSSSEEKDKNDFSGETGQDEDEDQKSPKSKIDSESANLINESDSDSDLGTPSSYKLQPVPRVSKSSSKRTREVDQSQSPVRSSKKPKPVGSSTPGGCINRLWSDEEELTVLNGMVKFNNNADIGAFYNFINGKLEEKFSKDQLISKIKRMKKRYSNAMKKSENGEEPVFSKPHEVKAFELSKKIWGGFVDVKAKNGKKDEKKALKVEKVELDDEKENGKSVQDNGNEEVGFIGSKYPFLTRSFESIMSTMPSLEMSKSGMCFAMKRLSSKKAEELNEKWKVLIKEEVELNHKKLTLMQEQMNTALDFVE